MAELIFNEYPVCDNCNEDNSVLYMNVNQVFGDNNVNLRSCNSCGLIFTSPRPSFEQLKIKLGQNSLGAQKIARNRILYGVSLDRNIDKQPNDWRDRLLKKHINIFDAISNYTKVKRLHDVGCGVGYLLVDAKARGIEATGNDINHANYTVMKDDFGLDVYNSDFTEINVDKLDAVVMIDYIEHAYYPVKNLVKAFNSLNSGGILYLTTFHIGCKNMDEERSDWNMLKWNHVHHFSLHVILGILSKIGFNIVATNARYDSQNMIIIAKKPL
jgi:2-polyprenyl-3-methyl-5-hydroxy-6-metoxy-1,4-benzoquinol methylase